MNAILRLASALLSVGALTTLSATAHATPILAVDVKIGETRTGNSSDAAELDMLRTLSGNKSLFLTGKTDADVTSASAAPGMPGAWYLTDLTQPGYFALKFGTGGTNATATTFFFRNTGDLVPYGDIAAIASTGIAALQREWREHQILARAHDFAYESFRRKLALQLAS